ncbi:hypothetical protein MA16_Dca023867 [Dendrobium catenatum]|uniref:Uncharacterized protein n=1 Tax=Dendrobium catenatum TaxID=906689 RepID=A0A2I0XFM1_9ASPA|nr:hypothetical protein MA16_Dca023867 [Dendrobium catenatum]
MCQPGHQIAECPQAGFDRRSESISENFVRLAGRPRTVPPHTIFDGSSGTAGGLGSVTRRSPSGNRRELSGSVAPAPIQPCMYSLNQHEARDAPDVVAGTVHISEHPCRVLFDSRASNSFIFECCFDALQLASVTLHVSHSVILSARDNLIARKSCLILLLISSYDIILDII